MKNPPLASFTDEDSWCFFQLLNMQADFFSQKCEKLAIINQYLTGKQLLKSCLTTPKKETNLSLIFLHLLESKKALKAIFSD